MTRIAPVIAVVFAAISFGCDQNAGADLLSPPLNDATILDIRNAAFAGTGVFLLPPIGDNDFVRTAPFDLNADPRLEICALDIDGEPTVEKVEAAECGEMVAWFEPDASHDGKSFVEVRPASGAPEAADSMYSVAWKTSDADAGRAFRVSIGLPRMALDADYQVSLGYRTAAHFNAMLYDNASTRLDPSRIVGSTAGQNFPIKFIVEEGASCAGLDCFAYEVTCEAAVYQTAHAGVSMPEDWASECNEAVPGPERSWWLFQQRLPDGVECLPSSLFDGVALGACYIWQLAYEDDTGDGSALLPYTEEFRTPVTVQFCNDEVPENLRDLAGIFRYSAPPGEVALVEEAHENALSEFTCPYVEEGVASSMALSLADMVIRPALRLLRLEPRPLFAGDGGVLSGSTIRMSDFQRGMQLRLDASSETSLAAILGGTEPIQVRLTTPPHGEPLDGPSAGVPGLEVQFRVVSGEADLSAMTPDAAPCLDGLGDPIDDCLRVPTTSNDASTTGDEGGYAGAVVAIGGDAGTVVIEATVPADPDMAPVTFTVEAVDLVVAFLEPLDSGGSYGVPVEYFVPVVYICAESVVSCTAATAEVVRSGSDIRLVTENTGRKFYQTDWKPRDTATPHGAYFVAVVVDDGIVGRSIPIVVTKGGKGEHVDGVYYNGENSTLATKFTITPAGAP